MSLLDRLANYDQPKIEGYQILGQIGAGGHSVVYKATDRKGRRVAIKRWLSQHQKAEQSRIVREVKALRALKHPGIVRFRGVTRDSEGLPCLIMDLVKGRSVSECLEASGPLTNDEALRLALDLTKVLIFLGEKGIVHRDIKPSNVILKEPKKRAILVDFSIVKALNKEREQSSRALTKTRQSVGTSCYMAPEQCSGGESGSSRFDERVDIYGLGALLFHCVTGYPPWSEESAWERQNRNPWRDPFPTDKERRRDVLKRQEMVSPSLGEIIETCLQGKPDDRYESALELARVLGLKQGEDEAEQDDGGGRYPVTLILGLVLLLGFLMGSGFFIWSRSRISNGEMEGTPRSSRSQELPIEERDSKVSSFPTALIVCLAPVMSLQSAIAQHKDLIEKKGITDPEGYFVFPKEARVFKTLGETGVRDSPQQRCQISWKGDKTYKTLPYKTRTMKLSVRAEDKSVVFPEVKEHYRVCKTGLFRFDEKTKKVEVVVPFPRFDGQHSELKELIVVDGEKTERVKGLEVWIRDKITLGAEQWNDCLVIQERVWVGKKLVSSLTRTYARGIGLVKFSTEKATFEWSKTEAPKATENRFCTSCGGSFSKIDSFCRSCGRRRTR